MKRFLIAFLSISLAACAATFPRPPATGTGAAAAQDLLDASIRAHGGYLFGQPATVEVAYDGRWRQLIKKIQPVLVDEEYRQSSRENLDLATGRLTQVHSGPEGQKRVVRTDGDVEVSYDGVPATADDVRDAAALVADAYTMFLTGPSYFRWRDAELSLLSAAERDGRRFARIHATLTPGFGFSERDEAVLWIDQETDLLHLVHFTIEGLASTRGAHVDVAFSEFDETSGYIWPTRFFERVRGPLRIDAHSWQTVSLAVRPEPSNDNRSGRGPEEDCEAETIACAKPHAFAFLAL